VVTAKSEVDSKFLYYVLSDNNFFNYDNVTSKGTKMPRGTPNAIMKYLVPKMSMLKQKRIVSILSAYDNMIEVNNKRIKVLEQMAEKLYKEWFVRFRFPSHETAEFVESRIGQIPSSFSVAKMQSIIEYYIGGGWGNDDEDKDFTIPAYVIRGTDFPHVHKGDLSTCPLRFHKESNYSSRQLKPNDIILEVSGGTDEQPVGRTLLVNKDTIERLGGNVICASFCKQVRVKEGIISPVYFYYWMQFIYNTRIIDRFQLQSTGIINFQFEFFLRKGDVMLPPRAIMSEFDKRIKPIHDEISAMAKQNENLIKQRDLLLPRLMSGKLEV
jgi:type I restriction enzyme S subunit